MSRYFRFGLRTILIVTTIAAVLFAWLGRDIMRARREKPLMDAIVSVGGSIHFEGNSVSPMDMIGTYEWREPTFLQRQFGDHYGAYVEEVSLRRGIGNATDTTIQGLGQFERLRAVSLRGRGFTDKCVDELLLVKELKSLELVYTSISAAGLKRLAKSGKLERLELYDGASSVFLEGGPSVFGNAHLESLSDFPALRRLEILGEDLTDEGFAHVGKCTELIELVINVVPATAGDAFEQLTSLQQLQTLDISSVAITDKSMLAIGKLRRLKRLQLDTTSITDQGLANLHGLTELEELELDRCKVNGSGFAALSSLKNLQKVSVRSTSLNDEGLAAIANLPGLVELEIDEAKVTGQGLLYLEHATKLKRLSIELSRERTLNDAKALKTKLPNCRIEWYEWDDNTGTLSSGSL